MTAVEWSERGPASSLPHSRPLRSASRTRPSFCVLPDAGEAGDPGSASRGPHEGTPQRRQNHRASPVPGRGCALPGKTRRGWGFISAALATNGPRLSGFACGRGDVREGAPVAPHAPFSPLEGEMSALADRGGGSSRRRCHPRPSPRPSACARRGLLVARAAAGRDDACPCLSLSSRFRQSRRPGPSNPRSRGPSRGVAASDPRRGWGAAFAYLPAPADTGYPPSRV